MSSRLLQVAELLQTEWRNSHGEFVSTYISHHYMVSQPIKTTTCQRSSHDKYLFDLFVFV